MPEIQRLVEVASNLLAPSCTASQNLEHHSAWYPLHVLLEKPGCPGAPGVTKPWEGWDS